MSEGEAMLRRAAAGLPKPQQAVRLHRLAAIMAFALALLCGCATPSTTNPTTDSIRKVIVNGAEISYVEQGAGETVVFLHGVGSDLRIWGEVAPLIASRFRFVAYSRRHHAPNAWPDDGSSHRLAQHVEDLVAFIRALGVAKAHVVAVSLGARVAIDAALAHPEAIATLVVNDALAGTPTSDDDRKIVQEFFRLFAPFANAVKAGDADAAAVSLVDWLYGSTGAWNALPPSRRAYYRDNAPTLVLALRNDTNVERPACSTLANLPMPVLVMDGVETPAAFRVTSDAFFACLPPNAKRARIADAGHFWYVDNPRAGADVILEFLTAHPL